MKMDVLGIVEVWDKNCCEYASENGHLEWMSLGKMDKWFS